VSVRGFRGSKKKKEIYQPLMPRNGTKKCNVVVYCNSAWSLWRFPNFLDFFNFLCSL